MLELKSVSKIYRMGSTTVNALDSLDLEVESGEFLAIIGPSGSGKSTLLHIMGLLDSPTSGQYLFFGRDSRSFSDTERAAIRNREIGFVFQNFNLLGEESALRNVSLPLFYGRVRDPLKKAAAALDKVGLGGRVKHRPGELSGGEQQRVAIARALVKEPKLILADEPTGNLDSASGNSVMDILKELNASGITLVLITHDVRIAEMARRNVRLEDGKIVESADQLPGRPGI